MTNSRLSVEKREPGQSRLSVDIAERVPIRRGLPPAPRVPVPDADYLQTKEGQELILKGIAMPENLGPGEKRQFDAALEAFPEIQEIADRAQAAREMQDTEPQQKRAETLKDIVDKLGLMTAESVASGEGNAKYAWKMFDTFMTGAAEVLSPTGLVPLRIALKDGQSVEQTMSEAFAKIFTGISKGELDPVERGDEYQAWDGEKYITMKHTTASAISANLETGAVRLAPELLAQLMDNPYLFAKGLLMFPYEEIKLILQAGDVRILPTGIPIPVGAIDIAKEVGLPRLEGVTEGLRAISMGFTAEEVAAARKELMRNPIGVAMLGLLAVGAGRGLSRKGGRVLVPEKTLLEQQKVQADALAKVETLTKAEKVRADVEAKAEAARIEAEKTAKPEEIIKPEERGVPDAEQKPGAKTEDGGTVPARKDQQEAVGEVQKGEAGGKEVAKQPWEMTQQEIHDQVNSMVGKRSGEVDIVSPFEATKTVSSERSVWVPERKAAEQRAIQKHENIIRQALSEGKPVPAEVLKDYPDLGKKAPGAAGAPGSVATARTKVSMEPEGKTEAISRDKVVDHFRKSFDIPIRVGKFKEKAIGIFKIREEVVRTREANDLGVISHEVGHYLEKKGYGGSGDQSALRQAPAAAKKELVAMGKELYGKRKPNHGYRTEGFAEYIAHWLITDEVGRIAPEFSKFFESDFLKKNPEIATALKQGRDLIRQYREQGAVARVYGNIDMTAKAKTGPIKERAKDALLRINTLFADDLAPLEFVEKQIRGVGELDPLKVDPLTSPTMMARSFARAASGKARMMVLHGTFDIAGKKTGLGLREILEPVASDFADAITYSYAKRALELHKRGIDPGITIEDAKYVVSKLENPVRAEYHKNLTGFENNVMDYLVDAGGMSKDAAKVIMDLNPSHIPLKRSIESQSFSGGGGKRFADISSPIKRIKGGGLKIRNPITSIVENTTAIINFADKTRVAQALVDLAEKSEGKGKWVEKLPAPTEVRRFSLEAVAKQLEDAGVDLSSANMEQVLSVYSNAGMYKGVDNVVSLWRDGERSFYQVDKRLYGTLKAIDEVHLPGTIDFLFGKPARAIRLGATGLNAGFGLITNPLRDAFNFGLRTEFTTGSPHLIAEALIKRLGPENNMNLLYKRSGADFSQFLGMDRKSMKKAVTEVLASSAKRKALNVVGHPIEAMKDMFSFTESAPRLAEYQAAYKAAEAKYGKGSPQASIIGNLAGSEVTVNFRRAGVWGRNLNQIIPFWNAATQGVLNFGRFAKAHPTKAAIKAMAYVTIPTIHMWMQNKDKKWYRESPAWMRYGFWNLEVGTNEDGSPRIIRIPRPFEWGVVWGSTPEMAIDYWYSKDPAVVEDGLKYMVEQTIPLGPQYLPTSIKVPIELWANYDFFRERDIDPFFEVRTDRPEDRYSKYTLETSKFIGKTFGLSPRKIDHLIESTTGGLAEDILRAAEEAVGVRPGPKETPANIPIAGRLFQRTQTPEDRAKSLKYQRSEKLGQIRGLMKLGELEEAEDKLKEWNNRHPDFPISVASATGQE